MASSGSVDGSGSASKRTHPDEDDEDIRRSDRPGKGKLYKGFIADGRISIGSRKSRRSHRSGDEEDIESDGMQPLDVTEDGSESINHNHHWKKKLRTVSLNDNTQGESSQDPHAAREINTDHGHSNTATNQQPPNFDLNAKIEALRPLSLEDFTRKREESKKESRGRSSNSGRTTRQSNSGDRSTKAFDTGASSVGTVGQVGRSRRRPAAQSPVT